MEQEAAATKAEAEARSGEAEGKKTRLVNHIKLGTLLYLILWVLGFLYVFCTETGIRAMPSRIASILWFSVIGIAHLLLGLLSSRRYLALYKEGLAGKVSEARPHLSDADPSRLYVILSPYHLFGVLVTCLLFNFSANFTAFSWWVIAALVISVIVQAFLTLVLVLKEVYSDFEIVPVLSFLILYPAAFLLAWVLCYPFTAYGKDKLADSARHFPQYQAYYHAKAAQQRTGK